MKTYFKKKGFELAVNTLVVIILGIVMLGMGVFIFYKVQNGTNTISTKVDDDMRQMIESQMISSSEKVAIPFVTKDIERGKMVDFYMGIENIYDYSHTFKIFVEMQSMNPVPANPPHYVLAGDVITIKPHDRGYVRLNFFAPKDAPSKQFSYLISLCYDSGSDQNEEFEPCKSNTKANGDGKYKSFYPPKQMVYLTVK